MGSLLAIDGGRSRCRVALIGAGGTVEAEAEGRGLPAGEGLPAVAQAVGEAVALCAANPETVDVVGAGLAGLYGGFDQAPELAERLCRLLEAPRVVVAGDVVTAYLGALGSAPGVVVAAGTGAVALGVSPAGTVRADGWGHLLGDAGSGYWIGRRGLEEALRAADGRGGSAVLAGLAETHIGPLDSLPRRVAGAASPAALVAGFAPRVAEAARGGDPVAGAIWVAAGRELAASAAACLERLFPPSEELAVSWSGGLFAAGDLLLDPFLDHLHQLVPTAVPTPPAGDGLAGAALLVGGACDLLSGFIHDSAHGGPPLPAGEPSSAVLT